MKKFLKCMLALGCAMFGLALPALAQTTPMEDATAILTSAGTAWDTASGIIISVVGLGVIIAFVKLVKKK